MQKSKQIDKTLALQFPNSWFFMFRFFKLFLPERTELSDEIGESSIGDALQFLPLHVRGQSASAHIRGGDRSFHQGHGPAKQPTN